MKKIAVAALLLLPGACAETELIAQTGKTMSRPAEGGDQPPGQEGGQYKIGKPYRIGNIWYYPHEDFGYSETGVASWYGPNFHGQATANGETYDQNALTAAHRTLPLPSLVRVTNTENGRSIVLRINDRGPFAHNRIIDVSRHAAQLLGFERKGTAEVRVEILAEESVALKNRLLGFDGPAYVGSDPVQSVERVDSVAAVEPLPPPAAEPAPQPTAPRPAARGGDFSLVPSAQAAAEPMPAATGGAMIQAASFSSVANAERSVNALKALGPANMTPIMVNGTTFYRVRVGPVAEASEVARIIAYLKSNGYPDAKVVK